MAFPSIVFALSADLPTMQPVLQGQWAFDELSRPWVKGAGLYFELFDPSAAGSGSTPDATTTIKGRVKLAGAFGGTADLPTALGYADAAALTAAIATARTLAETNAAAAVTAQKGTASGLATLDSGGKVPSTQLPTYVDDVLEYANLAAFPGTGAGGIFYVAIDTGFTYRWTGSAYAQTNSLAAVQPADPTITSTVYASDVAVPAAPALVKSIGFSNAVAVAMEAFSAALPKNGRYNSPAVTEQGVIELDKRLYTADRTIKIDLTGASVSRQGLTIIGQGCETSKLYAPATSSAANFKDVDGDYCMLRITGDGSGKVSKLVLRDFAAVNYFTQGGDGTTRLTDPMKLIKVTYSDSLRVENVQVYTRNGTALLKNQFGFYFKNNYYAKLRNLISTFFPHASAGVAMNNTSSSRLPGVGFGFEENNSIQAYGLQATGANLGFYMKFEQGLAILGGDIETCNKGFLFDDRTQDCQVRGVRAEFHQIDSTTVAEDPSEIYLAAFSELSHNNVLEVALGASLPRVWPVIDRSASKSNFADTPQSFRSAISKGVTLTAGVSGLTVSTNTTDLPPGYEAASVTEVAWPGSYNQNRSWTFSVNPKVGSVMVRQWLKRVSGDGMMATRLESIDNQPIYQGSLIDPDTRFANASLTTIPIANTGSSWTSSNGGELTLPTTRPHYLQPGVRVTLNPVGGTPSAYVKRSPTSTSVVLSYGSDPGSITTGTLGVPSDMLQWLGARDVTDDWQEFVQAMQVRYAVNVLALTPADIPYVGMTPIAPENTGIAAGVVMNLHGFRDSRVNLDYTIALGNIDNPNKRIYLTGGVASTILTFTGNPANGDTFTIAGKVYTFQTTLTNSDGNVKIGATSTESRDYLVAAITLGSGAGTNYAASMSLNTTVTAWAETNVSTIRYARIVAKSPGTAGNSIAVTETSTNASFGGATLSGGTTTAAVTAAGLDTTPNGVDTTQSFYGYIGHTAMRVVLRGLTTNATACVWRCSDPIVAPGHRQVLTVT